MRLKNSPRLLKDIIKDNKKTHTDWIKGFEKNPNYLEFMGKEYADTDIDKIALGTIKKNSSVLSVGCGPGREITFLVRERNCKVTAIDISEIMISLSKKAEPRAKYIIGDASNIKLKERFDYVIILYNTINYLPKAKKRRNLIRNSYRHLRSGGKLILVTKHAFSDMGTFCRFMFSNKNFYFLPSQIKEWFKETTFNVSTIKIEKSMIIIAEKT